jgi:hypothetical protein
VARLLALNIGWYRQRYGDVPQEDLLGMLRMETLHQDGKLAGSPQYPDGVADPGQRRHLALTQGA